MRRLRTVTADALHQFEALFGQWIDSYRLAQEDQGAHSRDRCWNFRLIFWTFLWQIAQAGASCREAIRQAQALCHLQNRAVPPHETSPYCQARRNIPLERLDEIHRAVVCDTEATIATKDLWCGRHVRIVDASTLTAPDTPANQRAFPQQSSQKPGCGFPILRLIGLFSLATGLFTTWMTGPWSSHELVLFQSMWQFLQPGEVLLGDRGFGIWVVLAQCLQRKADGVFRVRGHRQSDWRRGQRLSKHERRIRWDKPRKRPDYLSEPQWALLPDSLDLRLVRVVITEPGFRTRKVILVTTMLDRKTYPAPDLADLYRRRWDMELSLRHLKSTLQMEHLSCKTPRMLEREIRMHFLVHNLVRRLMFEAARKAGVPLPRLSFAGALSAARRQAEAMLQARTQRQRRKLMSELYRVIAEDLLPDRPGRWEPRAIKKRPKPFPLLTCHRRRFREIPHRNRYWDGGPCKRKRAKYHRPN
jgi:Transposase DDE domain.